LAISDPLGITALPLSIITAGSRQELLDNIKDIVKRNDVKKIVLGLPKKMDGTIGPSAEKVLKFEEYLKNNLSVDIELEDERLTSAEANKRLIEGNVSRKERKNKADKVAAALILQNYLDRMNLSKGA